MTKSTAEFDYDSIEPGYYDIIFQQAKGAQSKWHHHKFLFLRECLGEYENHLDIGCGPGTFIGMLSAGKKSVGVDVSDPQIVYAESTYGAAGRAFKRIEPGESLPFADALFDRVTLIELIEHIDRPQALKLLREAQRLLKPGGRVIVTTPNYASAWPFVETVLNKIGRVSYEDQHIAKYTKPLLTQLFKDAGFTDSRVGSFQWSGPFWAAVSWKLSDAVNALEHKIFGRHGGLLLIGEAGRPEKTASSCGRVVM